jgi:hypothetical protein
VSQYAHACAEGYEYLPFSEALQKEQERIGTFFGRKHYSYVERGFYLNQIKRWTKYFDPAQLCIIQSELLFQEPYSILHKILTRLHIPFNQAIPFLHENGRRIEPQIEDCDRGALVERFRKPNAELYAYLETCDPAQVFFDPQAWLR